MNARLKFEDAVFITTGYVEKKCQTTNCSARVYVPSWRKPLACYCETCKAVIQDDFRSLNHESDIETGTENDDKDDSESD